MNFLYPVYTEITECQDCYKCVRQCPVKAIRVENGHAMIIPEMCIICGTCVIKCPSKAKRVRSDLQRAKQLISLKKTVIVSLAPSFVSEFPECTPYQLSEAIKKLGFTGVSETAIGADLVSAQVAEDLRLSAEGKTAQKLFLSSACPVVVEYIKHFMPDFTPFITDRSSPLLAHARFLHEQYGPESAIVFIGPCMAKKRESDVFKQIDLALTFDELRRWFAEKNIDPAKIQNTAQTEQAFIPFRAAQGAFFPIDGGMIHAVKQYDIPDNIRTMTVTGVDEIPASLAGLHNEKLENPLFIELLSCTGGCINGPASSKKRSTAIKHVNLVDYAQTAKNRLHKAEMKNGLDLCGTLPANRVFASNADEQAIRTALHSVGKYSAEDELNCASCGYDTCREFAKAILENRAEKTMCVSYMRKLAQKKANGLIQAIPSGVIICDTHLKIIECNKNFARLMGQDIADMYEAKPGLEGADLTKIIDFSRFFEDVLAKNGPDVIEREVRTGKNIFQVTIFAIEKEACAGGVVEDITAPQVQKDRIVNQAKKVITKNLSVVQKIAFLMGENAAETESMLNSIIDSFSDDTEKK
ncbi:PAS domain-containing protein [Treponema sp. OMZ 840]|uniref:[Fe-Fe] hydrogenase large subunit C-terminal domain-containing protein n=1 Tax=Treponema sp. OMZ 840 TaxID=244313 RepID=UPI003D91BF70